MNLTEKFKSRFTCDAPEYLPAALSERLIFLSCLRKENDHSIYLVNEKSSTDKLILKIAEKGAPNNLKREYELLSKIHHSGIPKAHFFDSDDEGREYLLRAFAEGDTLKSLLERDGVFSEHQTLEIALKICEILDHLHKQSPPVIYRDLSPENAVITPNGKISLIDFGISREVVSGKDFDTVYVGNVAFASPEQFGFTATDRRSDIFAIGKLMIYLATGETDLQKYTNKITDGGFRKIVAKCTRLSPEKRYPSVANLSGAIKRRLYPPTRMEYIVAAACTLLFVFAGLYFLRTQPAPLPPEMPVLAEGSEFADEVKVPVLIEVLYNGKPFSDCAVAVDSHHWFRPAQSGKAELMAYAYESYNIIAAQGNRSVNQLMAVERETPNISVSLDLALAPYAPDYLSLTEAADKRHEIRLDVKNADEITLTGQPNGVSVTNTGDGFMLVINGVEQPGHYSIFAECLNKYGRADTVISLNLIREAEIIYIHTAQGLDNMRENLSGFYALANNIDLKDYDSWAPVGTEEYPFTGTFDGGGYSISGLSVNGNLTGAGLFGNCERAVIRNVNLIKPNVNTIQVQSSGVAALVGRMNKGIIENCAVIDGSVSADIQFYGSAGGLCGINSGIISKCFNSARINVTDMGLSGTDSAAGGICGESTGYILGCGNAGPVSGAVLAAGITGFCDMGIVTRCYNAGAVIAPTYLGSYPAGGIVHMLGRGKRISYSAFETGTAPVGATVWNGGILLDLSPLPPDKIRDIKVLNDALSTSGTDFEFILKSGYNYPLPANISFE